MPVKPRPQNGMNKLTIRPKQSLGQNFLVDENIARKIIRSLAPNPEDVIIEIGPGFGVLTKYLIPAVKKVVAIEIDQKLAEQLRTEFGHLQNLEIVKDDFLKVDLASYFTNGKLRILGNIPYNITSRVMFKIFKVRHNINDMILMIQREVAERIVAQPKCKEYGILSVFSQLYSKPKILFHISRNVFTPKPAVDSAMVQWNFSQVGKFAIRNEILFDEIVHLTFQQRRKMLRNSLQQFPEFSSKLEQIDFDLTKRPEELTIDEFVNLSNQLAVW